MKHLIGLILLMSAASASGQLSHSAAPWVATVAITQDTAEHTVTFETRFVIAPACSAEVSERPGERVDVVAVSRNFVRLHGHMLNADHVNLSCHTNVTRRFPDPDAVYPR